MNGQPSNQGALVRRIRQSLPALIQGLLGLLCFATTTAALVAFHSSPSEDKALDQGKLLLKREFPDLSLKGCVKKGKRFLCWTKDSLVHLSCTGIHGPGQGCYLIKLPPSER